jgi:hypothetical protein
MPPGPNTEDRIDVEYRRKAMEKASKKGGLIAAVGLVGAVVAVAWLIRKQQAGKDSIGKLMDNCDRAMKKLDDSVRDWTAA